MRLNAKLKNAIQPMKPIFFAASHKNRPDGSALPGFDDYLHPARLYLQWGNPQRCNM
jgi:hypothetical protein